ncbi:MAG: DNA internalization-related competence protein ComEC/Rec2 [Proteobacteria bacterium]|nr:DNA internalization-related competence protein ComEC/Rec2 [Pseudomonadota bacterium]
MRPLLPVLFSFIVGILAGERFPHSALLFVALFVLSCALLLFMHLRSSRNSAGLSPFFSSCVTALPFLFLGALFILPALNHQIDFDTERVHILEHLRQNSAPGGRMAEGVRPVSVDFEAVVAKAPEYRQGRSTVVVEVERINNGGQWRDATGRVQLSVRSGLEGIGRGDSVRVLGSLKEPYSFSNPGGYDYKTRLASRSIYVTGSVSHPGLFVKVAPGTDNGLVQNLQRSIESARERLVAFIDGQRYDNPGIMKALAVGDKAGVSAATREAFAATGTSHLLAISGLHVGTVAFLSYLLVLFILKRSDSLMLALNVKKVAAVASIAPALLYAGVAGFPHSTMRAVIMLSVYVLCIVVGRGKEYLNVLALAALAILLLDPSALYEISFQLSFAAVAGIILIAPPLKRLADRYFGGDESATGTARLLLGAGLLTRYSSRLRRWAVAALIISASATLGTLPLVALHFNRISTVTLGANLLAIPVTGVAVPVLLAGSLFSALSSTLAGVLFSVADVLLSLLLAVVSLFAAFPWASVRVATPWWGAVVLFYLLILALLSWPRARLYRIAAPVILCLLCASSLYPAVAKEFGKELRVTFLSVGQGDSALIEFPGGATMLVDGGGFYYTEFDPGRTIVAPLLWRKSIERIDYMVLSHAQHDHSGGLVYIAENFDVGQFWWNGVGKAEELLDTLHAKGVEVKVAAFGLGTAGGGDKSVQVEGADGVTVTVLSPLLSNGGNGPSLNDSSLVLRVAYKDVSFLFTGDIEAEGERGLVERAGIKQAASTVLKAPHHGSSTSSTPGFLAAVKPDVVVVSSGRYNPFGFPHRGPLNEYREAGARVYRTDLDGAVEVSTDGVGIKVRTYGE